MRGECPKEVAPGEEKEHIGVEQEVGSSGGTMLVGALPGKWSRRGATQGLKRSPGKAGRAGWGGVSRE